MTLTLQSGTGGSPIFGTIPCVKHNNVPPPNPPGRRVELPLKRVMMATRKAALLHTARYTVSVKNIEFAIKKNPLLYT